MSAMFARGSSFHECALKAVMLYDEFASGCRAKAYFDGLSARWDNRLHVSVNLWRFDVLTLPSVVDASLADASDADLVGVAIRPSGAVTPAVAEWLATWAVARTVPDAALMLVHESGNPSDPTSSSSVGLLNQIADKHGLHLIAPGGLATGWSTPEYAASLWRREHLVTSTLHDILAKTAHDPHCHWGINE